VIAVQAATSHQFRNGLPMVHFVVSPRKNTGWQPALRNLTLGAKPIYRRRKIRRTKKASANRFDSRGPRSNWTIEQ
jgi:hypothetical protein